MPESKSRQLPPRPEKTTAEPSSHARRWPWILPWALGIMVAATLGWTNFTLQQQLETAHLATTASEAEVLRLRGDAVSLRNQLGELETELEAIAESGNQSAEAALRRQREIERARRTQSVTQQEFEAALANSQAQREAMAERIVELENNVEQLREEIASAKLREANLRESVEQSKRLTDALQAQLQGKEQAFLALERSYQRFKDSSQSASRQLETISRTLTELEELNQRRARILEQATRRLKDLSDSYRTIAVRIDSDPSTQGTLNAEVSRLQSSVLAVEDQVAQFNTLNTQASQLERRLGQLRSAN